MQTAKHQNPTTVTGKRAAGLAAATLVASAMLTLVPTAASAFNIGGLIGSALSVRYGGGGGHRHHARSESHHSRDRVASHRGHDSNAEEKDARDVDAADQDGKVSPSRQHVEPSSISVQASQSDATAAKLASTNKATDDEPTFAPSR